MHAQSGRGRIAGVGGLHQASPPICTGDLVSPGLHLPTGTLRSGQRGRGGYNEAWLGRHRPRTAVFEQRELANTLMQHICKPKNRELHHGEPMQPKKEKTQEK